MVLSGRKWPPSRNVMAQDGGDQPGQHQGERQHRARATPCFTVTNAVAQAAMPTKAARTKEACRRCRSASTRPRTARAPDADEVQQRDAERATRTAGRPGREDNRRPTRRSWTWVTSSAPSSSWWWPCSATAPEQHRDQDAEHHDFLRRAAPERGVASRRPTIQGAHGSDRVAAIAPMIAPTKAFGARSGSPNHRRSWSSARPRRSRCRQHRRPAGRRWCRSSPAGCRPGAPVRLIAVSAQRLAAHRCSCKRARKSSPLNTIAATTISSTWALTIRPPTSAPVPPSGLVARPRAEDSAARGLTGRSAAPRRPTSSSSTGGVGDRRNDAVIATRGDWQDQGRRERDAPIATDARRQPDRPAGRIGPSIPSRAARGGRVTTPGPPPAPPLRPMVAIRQPATGPSSAGPGCRSPAASEAAR